jgi:hypothetical protein
MADDGSDLRFQQEVVDLRTDLAKFRNEIPNELRSEIQTERVRRAEKHTEYMRNWLGLLSLIVTILFVLFGSLGIRSYLDIHNFRNQMEADAGDVSAKKKEVDDAAAKIGQLTKGLEDRVQTLGDKLSGLEKRYDFIQTQFAKVEGDVSRTKVGVQQNRIDTSNLRSNLGGLAGADPIILITPSVLGEQLYSTIEGKNFGKAPGHLYAYVQAGLSAIQSASGLSGSRGQVDIERSSIQSWTDTNIIFTLSSADESAIKNIANKDQQIPEVMKGLVSSTAFVSFAVANISGKVSGWSSTVMWPTYPTSVLPQSPLLNSPTLNSPAPLLTKPN